MNIDTRPSETVDFARIVRLLMNAAGMSRHEIALHANVPRTSLFNYEQGVMPLHPAGERLIELWCGKMQRTRDDLPKKFESPTPNGSRFPQIFHKATTS
jgi:transcriptional regulator with XRE-family HTH domain